MISNIGKELDPDNTIKRNVFQKYIKSGKMFNKIRYSNSFYNGTFPFTKLNLILFDEKIA